MIKIKTNETVEIPTWVIILFALFILAIVAIYVIGRENQHNASQGIGTHASHPYLSQPSFYTKK